LKGIIPGNHSFQGVERFILLQIGLFNRVEETHVSLRVKLSKLEITGISKMAARGRKQKASLLE
jgi:hypothetical protein